MIDARADISPDAIIAENVSIGPWSTIGPGVEIGEGTTVGSHVVIRGPTKIGKNNKIYPYASVGEDPQDLKWNGEKTFLEIGDNNTIREFCTLNRGTVQGGGTTRIGNNNLLMAYVHVAHDCIVQNNTILANNAALSGHVLIEDYAIVSGLAAVHQYCVVGAHSFVGGATYVLKDVLPYVLVSGYEAAACGLNVEGLKRRGFSPEKILQLKRAYKVIFRNSLTVPQAIEELKSMIAECAEVSYFIEALQRATRGIIR